jgi:hypothetical protein
LGLLSCDKTASCERSLEAALGGLSMQVSRC